MNDVTHDDSFSEFLLLSLRATFPMSTSLDELLIGRKINITPETSYFIVSDRKVLLKPTDASDWKWEQRNRIGYTQTTIQFQPFGIGCIH